MRVFSRRAGVGLAEGDGVARDERSRMTGTSIPCAVILGGVVLVIVGITQHL
jgi:hypothetical protein